MTKKLVFQINVPNHILTSKASSYTYIQDMYAISERNARLYATKNKADYYLLTRADDFKPAAHKHLDYQKLKMYDFLEYDQIIYFDSDYVIKDNAPNLFDLCKDNFSAVTDPGKSVPKLAETLGIDRNRYFNAGFMYMVKDVLLKTKDFLSEYLENDYQYDGQGILNKLFFDKNIKYIPLNSQEWNPVDQTFGRYADHYSGKNKILWDPTRY